MHLVLCIYQSGIDTQLFVAALLKEVDSDLLELSVAEDVLFLLDILRYLSAELLKLRLEQIRGAAIDRLHIADYPLAELGIDRHRRRTVLACYKIFELVCTHLIALACDNIEHRLSADYL